MSEQGQQLSGGEGFATGTPLDDAQNAIIGMFDGTLEEEQSEGDEEIVDESLIDGEADESEVEESEEDFDDGEEVELDDEEYDQDEDESAQAETFTVKVDGEQVRVSLEELQNGYSRQSDYTKKSQALAEERKSFDGDRSSVTQERQQYAQLLGALQMQLQASDEPAPDFDRLYDEDPLEATRLEREWGKKQTARQNKMQAIFTEQERVAKEQSKFQAEDNQRMLQAEISRLPEIIPEWKDQKVAARESEALRQYLTDQGVAEDEMSVLVKADHIGVLRKAMLYDQGKSRVKKATKNNRSKSVRAGASGSTPKPSSKLQKQKRQQLRNSGKVGDAANLLESFL
tara:strand:+ start:105 stop:1133 length:1029 start_codon:yes stop_codon:yes gene_type:complete